MLSAKEKRAVIVLSFARNEARLSMNGMQYCHSKDLVRRLVHFNDEREMIDMPISTVGQFHQLSLTGGIFGELKFGILFKDYELANEIVVLKTINMENQDEVSEHWLLQAENRLDVYLENGITESTIVYHG